MGESRVPVGRLIAAPSSGIWWFWAGVVATTLLRVLLAVRLPLADDEAYYWLWASHLAWGYPDQPPMIAALVAASTSMLGDDPFAIRAIPMLVMSSLPLLVLLAGRALFDQATGLRAAALVMALPYVVVTAGAYPDVPLLCFWALGLWTGWRALQQGGWWWMAAAASAAGALLSKLTALFLLAGLAVAWASGPWRRSLRDPWWYAGIILGIGLLLPTAWWNTQHNWEMLRTALYGPPLPLVRSLGENLLFTLGGQVLYFGPLALLLLWGVVGAARRLPVPAWGFLTATSAPLMLAFVAAALLGKGKPHWPAPAYLAAVIATAALWPQWRRRGLVSVGFVGSTVLLVVISLFVVLGPVGVDLSGLIGRWDRVARAASLEARSRDAFIFTGSYQSASQIAYSLRRSIVVTTPAGAFPLWHRSLGLTGRKAVYVEDRPGRSERSFIHLCENPHQIGVVPMGPDDRTAALFRRPELSRVARLYACERFRGFPDRRAF